MIAPFTVIDEHTPPPVGWPKLTEVVVNDYWQARKHCGGIIASCTVVNFCTMTSTIYTGITPGTEYYALMLEHERRHGEGYDHVGESTNRAYFAAWRPWLESGRVPQSCGATRVAAD